MKRTLFSLGLGLWLFFAAGCSDTVNGTAIAEPEVARFREQMKARQYEAIYMASHKDLQGAIAKEKMVALLEAIGRKLGTIKESKQVNWNVRTNNGVTHVVLVYANKYTDGDSTETFTYRVSDGKAQLVGFNISSLEMLIK